MSSIFNLLALAAILALIGILLNIPIMLTLANIPFFGASLASLLYIVLGDKSNG